MCTVKEIREAIREDCHSQHGMEFIEIDRVLQTLPCLVGKPAEKVIQCVVKPLASAMWI